MQPDSPEASTEPPNPTEVSHDAENQELGKNLRDRARDNLVKLFKNIVSNPDLINLAAGVAMFSNSALVAEVPQPLNPDQMSLQQEDTQSQSSNYQESIDGPNEDAKSSDVYNRFQKAEKNAAASGKPPISLAIDEINQTFSQLTSNQPTR